MDEKSPGDTRSPTEGRRLSGDVYRIDYGLFVQVTKSVDFKTHFV